MRLLHLKLFIAVWVVIMIAGSLVSTDLLTANLYSARVMNLTTFLWISFCFLAFWMGTFVERSLYQGKHDYMVGKSKEMLIPAKKLEKTLTTFKGVFAIAGGVILIRVIWCIVKVGTLKNTLLFAITNPNHFKFDIWQATTIHGMGAVSDVIIACAIFSFALFALMKKYRHADNQIIELGYDSENIKSYYRLSIKLVIISCLLLAAYSILSNERVALVLGFVGGSFAYLLITRKFPLKVIISVLVALFIVWVIFEGARREYFGSESLGFILEYAKNRLLLYLVSGLRNVDIIVNYLPNHTYGWYTFNFLLITFKLDFLSSISDSLYGFTPYHVQPGFGVIPVFGIAFADFGLASILYFVIIGFGYQRLYRKAILEHNFLALQLYALFLVALLISFMAFMPAVARFWVNVLAIVVINKCVTMGLPGLNSVISKNRKYLIKTS